MRKDIRRFRNTTAKQRMTEKIWNSSNNFPTSLSATPCSSVSSMAANPCKGDETSSEEEDAARSEAPKKKRKQKSKSSASQMIEFPKEFKDDKQKEEKEKLAVLNKMHMEKMNVMNRFSAYFQRSKITRILPKLQISLSFNILLFP